MELGSDLVPKITNIKPLTALRALTREDTLTLTSRKVICVTTCTCADI